MEMGRDTHFFKSIKALTGKWLHFLSEVLHYSNGLHQNPSNHRLMCHKLGLNLEWLLLYLTQENEIQHFVQVSTLIPFSPFRNIILNLKLCTGFRIVLNFHLNQGSQTQFTWGPLELGSGWDWAVSGLKKHAFIKNRKKITIKTRTKQYQNYTRRHHWYDRKQICHVCIYNCWLYCCRYDKLKLYYLTIWYEFITLHTLFGAYTQPWSPPHVSISHWIHYSI